jgi:hypothetical protein
MRNLSLCFLLIILSTWSAGQQTSQSDQNTRQDFVVQRCDHVMGDRLVVDF